MEFNITKVSNGYKVKTYDPIRVRSNEYVFTTYNEVEQFLRKFYNIA